MVLSQDWLKAWKSWAATRKRGKMAQFIVQKLEDNVSIPTVQYIVSATAVEPPLSWGGGGEGGEKGEGLKCLDLDVARN